MAEAARINPAAVLKELMRGLGGMFMPRPFLQGLAGGAALLMLYAAWLWSHAGTIETARQARLAATTASIDMSGLPRNGISLETMPGEEQQAATPETPASPDHPAVADTHEAAEPEHAAAAATPAMPAEPNASTVAVAAHPAATPAETVALAPAPVDGLYETTAEGKLPVIDKRTGHTPFQTYRRPFDSAAAAGKSLIALVVTDAGISQAATDAALADFPPQVSIALSPYAGAPDAVVGAARGKGHEVWMVLPMQSPVYPRVDPGPHTMLAGVPSEDNLKKLDELMGRATGYVGFIGSKDADFTAFDADFHPVADAIYGRGLGFIDPSGKAPPDLTHHNARADVWFERNASKSDIDAALKRLEDAARMNGHAVGVIPPLPLIYPAVREWIKGLQQKGFVVAPLSAVADLGVVPAAKAPAPGAGQEDGAQETPPPPVAHEAGHAAEAKAAH